MEDAMTEKSAPKARKPIAKTRDERLKAALKSNLQRRKVQARARQGDGKDKG